MLKLLLTSKLFQILFKKGLDLEEISIIFDNLVENGNFPEDFKIDNEFKRSLKSIGFDPDKRISDEMKEFFASFVSRSIKQGYSLADIAEYFAEKGISSNDSAFSDILTSSLYKKDGTQFISEFEVLAILKAKKPDKTFADLKKELGQYSIRGKTLSERVLLIDDLTKTPPNNPQLPFFETVQLPSYQGQLSLNENSLPELPNYDEDQKKQQQKEFIDIVINYSIFSFQQKSKDLDQGARKALFDKLEGVILNIGFSSLDIKESSAVALMENIKNAIIEGNLFQIKGNKIYLHDRYEDALDKVAKSIKNPDLDKFAKETAKTMALFFNVQVKDNVGSRKEIIGKDMEAELAKIVYSVLPQDILKNQKEGSGRVLFFQELFKAKPSLVERKTPLDLKDVEEFKEPISGFFNSFLESQKTPKPSPQSPNVSHINHVDKDDAG